MNVLKRVSRCAVVAFLCGWLSTCAVGQSDNNPFELGEPGDQQPQPRRAVENPFGETFDSAPAATQPGGGGESFGRKQPAPPPAAAPGPDAGCQCLGESGDSVSAINKALDRPLNPRGLEYDGDSLEEVVAELSAEYDVPIHIDARVLSAEGLGPDEPVTISVHGISLKSALNHMLRQHDLTHIIQNEVLLITTPTEAEEQLKVCIYDVRDLIDGPKDKAGIETLIGVIQTSVAAATWQATAGGGGNIRSISPGLLVVSQTHAVHAEIRELLTVVRRMRAQRPAGAGQRTGAAPQTADDEVVTRFYSLQVSKPDDQQAFQNQLRVLIVALTPELRLDTRFPDGQSALLAVLPDRVVVRHRDSVQQQVAATLQDIGITPQAQQPALSGGFGGGGGGGFFQPRPDDD